MAKRKAIDAGREHVVVSAHWDVVRHAARFVHVVPGERL